MPTTWSGLLRLAERGIGRTAAQSGGGRRHRGSRRRVVGQGHHERAGEPHAEARALEAAGPRARGATIYCTLEPAAIMAARARAWRPSSERDAPGGGRHRRPESARVRHGASVLAGARSRCHGGCGPGGCGELECAVLLAHAPAPAPGGHEDRDEQRRTDCESPGRERGSLPPPRFVTCIRCAPRPMRSEWVRGRFSPTIRC